MKMSSIQPGMRLRSTISRVPMEEFITVTELTESGFRFSLDAEYVMITRWGMTMAKDGHEHFGFNGEAFYEPVYQCEGAD
jgi:hypothetical protein